MREEHKYCLLCGRELKNPETKIIGYGPICYKKMTDNNRRTKKLFEVGVTNVVSVQGVFRKNNNT